MWNCNFAGFAGKSAEIQVILVGTYAPEPPILNANGTNLLAPLLSSLKEFTCILGEDPQVVALDATNPSCPGLKLLRTYLNNTRSKLLEVITITYIITWHI